MFFEREGRGEEAVQMGEGIERPFRVDLDEGGVGARIGGRGNSRGEERGEVGGESPSIGAEESRVERER